MLRSGPEEPLASTARYRFEFQLFEWAEGLSKDLCGDSRCFFIGLRPEGSVRRIYFARPGAPFPLRRFAESGNSM